MESRLGVTIAKGNNDLSVFQKNTKFNFSNTVPIY